MTAIPKRIDLATTPLRYDLKAAREAAATYNRIAGFASFTLGGVTRLTIPQIVNGPIKNGDLDAIVTFLHQGLVYVDKSLEQGDIEKLLGHYIRPSAKGGKGGKLLDFVAPIRQALLDNGVIEEAESETEDEREAEPEARPTLATVSSHGREDL